MITSHHPRKLGTSKFKTSFDVLYFINYFPQLQSKHTWCFSLCLSVIADPKPQDSYMYSCIPRLHIN